MKKIPTILLLLLMTTSLLNATTYNWIAPTAGVWDSPGTWQNAADPSDTNHWPTARGDVAVLPLAVGSVDPDVKQYFMNANGTQPITYLGELHTENSNYWTQIGTWNATDLLIFDNQGKASELSYYSHVENWNRLEFPIWSTKVILSNDLNIHVDGVLGEYGYDYANRIIIAQESGIYGDHHIIHHGPGSLCLGIVYDGSEPDETQIMTTKSTIISNGYCEVEAGPIYAAPVMVTYGYRGEDYVSGDIRQGSFPDIDVDIQFRGGAHVQNLTALNNLGVEIMLSPLTNNGNFMVESQADLLLSGGDGTLDDTEYYYNGTTMGTNYVVNWWPGGKAHFSGKIAPGFDDLTMGWLSFVDINTNDGIVFGAPGDLVDLEIDLENNNSDWITTENLPGLSLSTIRLKLNVIDASPSDTNMIWYSYETLEDNFGEVEIEPAGAQATILYYANSVEITDVILPEPVMLSFLIMAISALAIYRRK